MGNFWFSEHKQHVSNFQINITVENEDKNLIKS